MRSRACHSCVQSYVTLDSSRARLQGTGPAGEVREVK